MGDSQDELPEELSRTALFQKLLLQVQQNEERVRTLENRLFASEALAKQREISLSLNLAVTRVPRLNDSSDYSRWRGSITSYLNRWDMERYIEDDIPEPKDSPAKEDWKFGRDISYRLITETVRPELAALHDESPDDAFDPFAIWKSIESSMTPSCEGERAEMARQFANLDGRNFESTTALLTDFLHMKRVLEKSVQMDKRYFAWVLLNSLKDSHCYIYQDYCDEHVIEYEDVMKEIAEVARLEDSKGA